MIKEKDLPKAYQQAMEELLGEDYPLYLESLKEKPCTGFRVNTLKVLPKEVKALLDRDFTPVPWVKEGFYFEEERGKLTTPSLSGEEKIFSISKNPYYFAGLYYIQEPSAMTPASISGAAPGQRVLDLCAAPGGKSTQLAAMLGGRGLLVSNDVSASRGKALLKNLEQAGAGNMLVTNETPQGLAKVYPEYFDVVLVDAPCSGEGMFRRDRAVFSAYLKRGPEAFVPLQRSILEEAAKMLAPGGTMVYSTCTYSVKEDEEVLLDFLEKHPDFYVDPIEAAFGFAPSSLLPGAIRLLPHRLRGEGHFVSRLKRRGEAAGGLSPQRSGNLSRLPGELEDFLAHTKKDWDLKRFLRQRDYIYYLPEKGSLFSGIHYLRTGLLLGEIRKNRFEPFQALAMHLKKEEWEHPLCLEDRDPRVVRYLKGETIEGEEEYKGLRLLCVGEYPLGFIKQEGVRCKNKYYPGWRWV